MTLVVAATLAAVGFPLAGVATVVRSQSQSLLRGAAGVLAGVCVFTLVSAAVTIASGAAPLVAPYALLATACLGLAALGAAAATLFADPLDAAAASLAASLSGTLGILILGPPAAALPTTMVNAALLASPIIATASAAGIDVLRSGVFYQLSPLSHGRFDYPSWSAAMLLYSALTVAAVAFTSTTHARNQR